MFITIYHRHHLLGIFSSFFLTTELRRNLKDRFLEFEFCGIFLGFRHWIPRGWIIHLNLNLDDFLKLSDRFPKLRDEQVFFFLASGENPVFSFFFWLFSQFLLQEIQEKKLRQLVPHQSWKHGNTSVLPAATKTVWPQQVWRIRSEPGGGLAMFIRSKQARTVSGQWKVEKTFQWELTNEQWKNLVV